MIKVGVTGGIGSGKTTVCKLFETLGIPVYYADTEAKRLMNFDSGLKHRIKELLGNKAYHRNGRLNRAEVASIVFHDKNKLAALNAIVHPAVGEDSKKWFYRQESPYAIKEAALLVENGTYRQLDYLIVVTAPIDIRIQRVTRRDKASEDQIKRRISNQLPEKEKVKVADFVIDNSGDKSLIRQVWEVHNQLLKM